MVSGSAAVWRPGGRARSLSGDAASASASAITNHSGFSGSQVVITFNDVIGDGTTPIAGQYAAQGVTFSGVLYGYATSYAGITASASGGGSVADFQNDSCPCFNDVTATFAGIVKRAGFDVFGNPLTASSWRHSVGRSRRRSDVSGAASRLYRPRRARRFRQARDPYLRAGERRVRHGRLPLRRLLRRRRRRSAAAARCGLLGSRATPTRSRGAPIPPGRSSISSPSRSRPIRTTRVRRPAIFVEGKGLTCDPPPPGYVQKGLAGDDQHVAGNFYPYYAPA